MLSLVYHFTINNLTLGQRLQIVQIYSKNRISVHFYVYVYFTVHPINGRSDRPWFVRLQNQARVRI